MNDFLKYKILVTDEASKEIPLLLQKDKIILSRGNIACITGKAKSKKTFLVSAFAAAFLENESLTVRKGIDRGKVLYIDTEQARCHVQKVQKRIYKLCGWPPYSPEERLTVLALRSLSSEERRNITEEAVKALKPDLIIIDGIRDLVDDFNDIKSSSSLVKQLMRITDITNCGILCILHQNKSDNNARGHLGTELTNKSETILQLYNIDDKTIVSPDVSRNSAVEQFAFKISFEGIPQLCDIPKNKASIRKEITEIMGPCKSMSKNAFIASYTTKTQKKKSSGYLKIKQAVESGILIETADILILSNDSNFSNSKI